MPIKTASATIATGLAAAVAAAAGAVTALLTLTACSPPSASARPAPKPVLMTDCNGLHHSRPGIVDVVCESDAITARSLDWSGWGKPFATASGTAVVDLCAFTDCHTGSYNAFPIVLVASKLVTCAKGRQMYSRLQYVFVGHNPFASLPLKGLALRNSLVGSHRPGPPHNDTVSLPC
jgi:hypothetical protein